MKSNKNAILIYGKDKIPMPFSYYKRYNIGTGYIALYEKTENCCVFCRTLDVREMSSYAYHRLMLNDKKIELSVIVLNSNLKSIEEADAIIKSYMKAFSGFAKTKKGKG